MSTKKLFALILSILSVLSIFTFSASAEVVKGDVDGDGFVTAADARLALRLSVGLESLDEYQIKNADIDGDNTVSAADARLILRASVGLERFVEETTTTEPEKTTTEFEKTTTTESEETTTTSETEETTTTVKVEEATTTENVTVEETTTEEATVEETTAVTEETPVEGEMAKDTTEVVTETTTEDICDHYMRTLIYEPATPTQKGYVVRGCDYCAYMVTEEPTYELIADNVLLIPSAGINVEYTVADYNQDAVDNNDVICNYEQWGKNDPVICGHSYNSLSGLSNVKVGDYIYFTHDGITDTYVVTHSEFGFEILNNTNIKGKDTGKVALYTGEVPTLHIFTCAYLPFYGSHRWMVVAEKV